MSLRAFLDVSLDFFPFLFSGLSSGISFRILSGAIANISHGALLWFFFWRFSRIFPRSCLKKFLAMIFLILLFRYFPGTTVRVPPLGITNCFWILDVSFEISLTVVSVVLARTFPRVFLGMYPSYLRSSWRISRDIQVKSSQKLQETPGS